MARKSSRGSRSLKSPKIEPGLVRHVRIGRWHRTLRAETEEEINRLHDAFTQEWNDRRIRWRKDCGLELPTKVDQWERMLARVGLTPQEVSDVLHGGEWDDIDYVINYVEGYLDRVRVDTGRALSPDKPLGDGVAANAVEAMETRDDAGIGGTDTDWKIVQGQLLVKRNKDEPYTSLRKLSAELKCSDATIRKAINESETLRGWQARSTGIKAAPKATDLSALVRDKAGQTTEPAPDDVLTEDDVDVTMALLIEQARPDERAMLNALNPDQRRDLVAAFQSQNLDNEPSPLKPDKPGVRPHKVKHHKRA